MSEQKKNNRSVQIFLCLALLAAVALNMYLLVQKNDLLYEKTLEAALHTEIVNSKNTLIAEKETIENNLVAAKAQIENAIADYNEATEREDALKAEVEALRADAEKANELQMQIEALEKAIKQDKESE